MAPSIDGDFDSETARFLTELRDTILRSLPLEKLPPWACSEVRAKIEQALADLAYAGQRDPHQLERYARAQINDILVMNLVSKKH